MFSPPNRIFNLAGLTELDVDEAEFGEVLLATSTVTSSEPSAVISAEGFDWQDGEHGNIL